MKFIQRSLLVLCLLSVLLAAACTPPSTPLPSAMATETQSVATASDSLAMPATGGELTGASLYKYSCAACHGKDRSGSTFELAGQTIKVPALDWNDLNILFKADPKRGSVPEQVALAITKGQDPAGGELNPMMPRWSDLSQAQVDSLIQHIQTAETTADETTTNLMGEQLYRTSCAACHGMDGAGKTFEQHGNTITTPSLHWNELRQTFSRDSNRGSVPEQIALAITKGQNETGAELNTMMPRWSFFSQAQVDSLVQYLQTTFK
jgi:mono/diheme cytochrome c family protein